MLCFRDTTCHRPPDPTQDYRIHHEEVCSKLVAIMRERLSANIKQLPALAAAWPAGPSRAEAPAPSSFATTAAKQLQVREGVGLPRLRAAVQPQALPAPPSLASCCTATHCCTHAGIDHCQTPHCTLFHSIPHS